MSISKVNTTIESLSPIILEILDKKIDITLTVTGTSMYPLLKHKKDRVILTSCDKFNLKKGDIPLYKRSSGEYVLHRIVKVNGNSYDLCGDNQYIVEKDVPKKNIIAVVKAFVRNDKTYRCDDVLYKIYWHLWIFSIPFRGLMQKSRRIIRRIK